MISRGHSAPGRRWPLERLTWWWVVRLSLPPTHARQWRTSRGHAPDDLLETRVPFVRGNEEDGRAGAQRQTRNCRRTDRHLPPSITDGALRDGNSSVDDRRQESGEVPNHRAGTASAAGWQALTQPRRSIS